MNMETPSIIEVIVDKIHALLPSAMSEAVCIEVIMHRYVAIRTKWFILDKNSEPSDYIFGCG